MAVFDWLNRKPAAEPRVIWTVLREGGELVVEDGRGGSTRVVIGSARNVRIVPPSAGNHQPRTYAGGWQVTLSEAAGDTLVGKPTADWRAAQELARLVCEKTELPLDDLTQRLFSRVGSYTPPRPD